MIQRFKTSMMLLGIAASAFAKGEEQKHNVLFIMIDDYGWADVGYNGSKFYETPNIDRLASEGMVFTNGYAPAPISSPTRVSVLTGKYPARNGITDWIPGPPSGFPSCRPEVPDQSATSSSDGSSG